jgi:hypothetical protein
MFKVDSQNMSYSLYIPTLETLAPLVYYYLPRHLTSALSHVCCKRLDGCRQRLFCVSQTSDSDLLNYFIFHTLRSDVGTGA